MTNRSKAIGTAAETAAKRYLLERGFTDCDRQPLRGNRDHGDLIICRAPKIIAEVKAGQAAEKASPAVIAEWMVQTDNEAAHANADLAVLIVRRKHRRPEAWDAWVTTGDWVWMTTDGEHADGNGIPVRVSLADWATAALWARERVAS